VTAEMPEDTTRAITIDFKIEDVKEACFDTFRSCLVVLFPKVDAALLALSSAVVISSEATIRVRTTVFLLAILLFLRLYNYVKPLCPISHQRIIHAVNLRRLYLPGE
jgi:hypothetical protein